MRAVWFLPILGAIAGGYVGIVSVVRSGPTLPPTTVAAIAVALAIVPYVFARSLAELSKAAEWDAVRARAKREGTD